MASHKNYAVFIDSNAAFVRKGNRIVHQPFENALDSLRNLLPGHIRFLMPEVVRDELAFQALATCLNHAERATSAIKSISKILGTAPTLPPDQPLIRRGIDAWFERWSHEKSVTFLPPPVDRVDWRLLIQRSTSRLPPFAKRDPNNPKNEKGFRDAVIAETILFALENLSSEEEAIVITDDDDLEEFLIDDPRNNGQLRIIKHISELVTEAQLLKDELTASLATTISSSAAAEFQRYWREQNLETQIKQEFPEQFSGFEVEIDHNSKRPIFLRPVNDLSFEILDTEFLSKEGAKYHWRTYVVGTQTFGNPSDAPIIAFLSYKERRVTIRVDWSVSISDGSSEFKSPKFSLKVTSRSVKSPWSSDQIQKLYKATFPSTPPVLPNFDEIPTLDPSNGGEPHSSVQ